MFSFKYLFCLILASLVEVKSIDSGCGGVISAESGTLNYRLNQSIQDPICIWTINVVTKLEVDIQMIADGFSWDCIGCQILSIYKVSVVNENVLQPVMQYNKTGDRNVYRISGSSVIQLVFVHNTNWAATGFSLTFKGVGKNNDGSDPWAPYGYKLYDQLGANSGVFRYPASGNTIPMNEIAIFAVTPAKSKHVAMTLESFNISTSSFLACDTGRNTFIVQDITKGNVNNPSTRFRECKTMREPVTIYSGIPLIVTFASDFLFTRSGFLQFSWKMVDSV